VKSIKRGAEETRRPQVRVGYALALAWIVVGSLLYSVEVLRLVGAIG
jgi:hypothetical protein